MSELFLYEDVNGEKYNLNRSDIDRIIEDVRYSNRNYFITKLDDNKYDFLIIGTSYLSPLDELDLIAKDLVRNYDMEDANVLFDFMLTHGSSKADNRFISVDFENSKFKTPSVNIAKNIDVDIRQRTIDIVNKNIHWVDKSHIISDPLKWLIKKGKAL